MAFCLTNTGPPLREEDVAALEARLGVRFPDEYRDFLLQWNGGETGLCAPEPERFLRVGEDDWWVDLETAAVNCRTGEVRLPDPRLIPVASGDDFTVFCISTDGPDAGSIYRCDFFTDDGPELGPNGELPPERVVRAADSFGEFLARVASLAERPDRT